MYGPYTKDVLRSRGHKEGTYAVVEHKEAILEIFLEVKEGDEVQSETEDIGESLPPLQR